MSADRKVLRGTDAQKFMQRILDEGVKPHAATLAPILLNRDVAVVVFEVADEMKDGLRGLGWKGEPVFALNRTRAEEMAKRSAASNDPVTAAWLRRRTIGRIFLWVQSGTFLLNKPEGEGLALEPGSSDEEYFS